MLSLGTSPSRAPGALAVLMLGACVAPCLAAQEFVKYLGIGSDRWIANGVGDLNGDGFGDFVVTKVSPPPPPALHAQALTGPSGSLLYDWAPALPSMNGYQPAPSLSGAVDLDQDGLPDVILTHVNYMATGLEVRSGADGSVLSILDPGLLWPGPISGIRNVAVAGDVNGDGVPEVIVTGSPWGAWYGVKVLSGPNLVELYSYGPTYGERLGEDADGLEDVDGDGLRDFFITAPEADVPALNAGRLDVYSGGTGLLIASLTGSSWGQSLGRGAAALEDVDGDGTPEIAITDYFPNGFGYQPARTRVLSAATFSVLYVVPPGGLPERLDDADGDGIDDFIVHDWMTGGVAAYSGATGAFIGGSAGSYHYAGVGDVNGDGLGDYATQHYSTTFPPVGPPGLPESLFWSGLTGDSNPQPFEAAIYVAPNFRLTAPATVGGAASLSVLAPKHPGKAFQIVLSTEGLFPGTPLGPFLFPLGQTPLLYGSIAAGYGGVLDASGRGSLTLPIPNVPSLQNFVVRASGWVIDPSAAPLPIACILTRLAIPIQ